MISIRGIALTLQKMGNKRELTFQQKRSYLFLQVIRAVGLISFSAKILI